MRDRVASSCWKAFILVGVICLVLLGLFPPWQVFTTDYAEPDIVPMCFPAGHHFLWLPPNPPGMAWQRRVDVVRLVTLASAILAVMGVGYLVRNGRKEHRGTKD
jgi:hypothetical protein